MAIQQFVLRYTDYQGNIVNSGTGTWAVTSIVIVVLSTGTKYTINAGSGATLSVTSTLPATPPNLTLSLTQTAALVDSGAGIIGAADPVALGGPLLITVTVTNTGATFVGSGATLSTIVQAPPNSSSPFKKDVAYPAPFQVYLVLSRDHVTPATGKTVAGQVSLDGAGFNNLANAVSEVGGANNGKGWYKVTLDAADVNGTDCAFQFTAAGCDPVNLKYGNNTG